MDLSVTAIRGFSREMINSINELAVKNDIYDRLALLILKEGYQGVFITREDKQGNLSGYVFKGNPDDLIKSELIQVPENSSAPVWAAPSINSSPTAPVTPPPSPSPIAWWSSPTG
jgi:hypothetical protein